MEFLSIDAPPLLAGSAPALRPVARRLALAFGSPSALLIERAKAVEVSDPVVGRVQSGGAWTDAEVHSRIAELLEPVLQKALRRGFEWYVCRGAFFHTDAHYANVLFGVWYIVGPPVDLVFPRIGRRLAAHPGSLAIFDPFEVHGVLRPGASEYSAADYVDCVPSVFVGFELELDGVVASRFDVTAHAADARLISSATRVVAATGAFE
jgi:hypothetical protein